MGSDSDGRGPLAGGEDGGQVRGPEQPRLPRPSIAGGPPVAGENPVPFVPRRGWARPARRARKRAAATAVDALDGRSPLLVELGEIAGRVAARAGRRRPAVNLIPIIRPRKSENGGAGEEQQDLRRRPAPEGRLESRPCPRTAGYWDGEKRRRNQRLVRRAAARKRRPGPVALADQGRHAGGAARAAATRRLLDWPLAPRRGARGRPLVPPLGPIGGFVTSSHAGVRPRPATAPGTPPPRPAVPAPPYVSRGPLKRGDCDLDLGRRAGSRPGCCVEPIASGPCGPSHRTRAVARAGHRLSS